MVEMQVEVEDKDFTFEVPQEFIEVISKKGQCVKINGMYYWDEQALISIVNAAVKKSREPSLLRPLWII